MKAAPGTRLDVIGGGSMAWGPVFQVSDFWKPGILESGMVTRPNPCVPTVTHPMIGATAHHLSEQWPGLRTTSITTLGTVKRSYKPIWREGRQLDTL
jgi:hypothetical protein